MTKQFGALLLEVMSANNAERAAEISFMLELLFSHETEFSSNNISA
jgi:hypothetical protein